MEYQGSTRSLLACTLKTASILGCGCVPVVVKHVTAVLVHLAARAPDEEKESICRIRVPDEPITLEICSGPHFVDESGPKRHILLVLELDGDDSGVSGLVPHPGGSKKWHVVQIWQALLVLGLDEVLGVWSVRIISRYTAKNNQV